MGLPPRSSDPSVPPPVKIEPDVSALRYKHLLKQIREGEVTLADLKAVQDWFSVDRYAPKLNKWKKEFPGGIKLVGFDKEPQTILNRKESAYGLDVDEWWASWLQVNKKPSR